MNRPHHSRTPSPALRGRSGVRASAAAQLSAQYGVKPSSGNESNSEFTTGVLFVKTSDTQQQNTIAYYHHDHLGTPLQATDKQGHIVWSASYEAFGQATITTPTPQTDTQTGQAAWGTITSNLRLPGQYADEETGLHYNWHRYYEPGTGRYVTRDPIGLIGGNNFYIYANASPQLYFDSNGLAPGDQWFGRNDPAFRDWVHSQKPGDFRKADQNYTKDEIEDLWKEWNDEGCPRGKGGKSGKGGKGKGSRGGQRGYVTPALAAAASRVLIVLGLIFYAPSSNEGEDELMQKRRDEYEKNNNPSSDCNCK